MAKRHTSAIKRHRQSLKRRAGNLAVRTHMRHEIRKVREAVAKKDATAASTDLRKAMKVINKAASKGVIRRNTASRYISRLSKQVATLSPAASA